MKSKTKKIVIRSGIGGVALLVFYIISTSTGLLGFLLPQCEKLESVELTESVDFRGIITKTLVKKCVTDTVVPKLEEEEAKEIIQKRDEYLKTYDAKEKKSKLIQELEAEVESLEILADDEPSLIPVLVTKMSQLEANRTEFGLIEMQVGSTHVEWMETLDGVNIIIPSEEQKEMVFSDIEVLNYPTVELDQKEYTWTDKVYLTIIDPWNNRNPNEIEMIGNKEDRRIKINTDSGNELNYTLIETGYDTGIFTGEIILTGFSSLDANNDGETGDASGITSGSGPFDGLLATEQEDGILISYQFSQSEEVRAGEIVKMNEGEIFFFGQESYKPNEIATIQVIDPDLNTNPEKIDFVKIKVSSDSTPDGIDIILEETNEATGWFQGAIKFTLEQEAFERFLKVSIGDEVMAIYTDKTLPKPHEVGESIQVVATAQIIE